MAGPQATPPPSVPRGTAVRKQVVLDTNALLLPFTDGTDLQNELEGLVGAHDLILPSSVVGELKMLAQGASAASRHAKAALRLAQRARTEPTGLAGDDGILDVARRLRAVVVTNDRNLQSEAAKSGLQVVIAREKGRLAFRGAGSA